MIELALMLLLLLLAYSVGAWVLRLFKVDYSPLESFAISVGLGFGIIAYLIFFLGIMGLLYTLTARILLLFLLIIAFPNIKSISVRLFKNKFSLRNFKLSRLGTIVALILLGHIVVNLITDMAPPMEGDTLHTYLAIPKIWIRNHKIVEIPYLAPSYMPANIQMLSTLGLLLKSDILSQLISGFLMSILAVLGIYLLARKWFSQEMSLVAAAIFYATRVVSWLAYSAKVDLGWTFFELLALFAFFNFLFAHGKEANKWIPLSAVFCGLSMGIKYSAAYSVVIIALGIIVKFKLMLLDRRSLKIALKPLFLFVIITGLVASPWYVRNYLLTGNPVYPLFSSPILPNSIYNQCSGVVGYLTIFWYMSLMSMSSGMSAPAGPVFIAFIPGLLFLRKTDYRIKLFLLYSLAFSILWYSQLQRTRHFLPALALLSIVAAYSIYKLMDSNVLLRRFVPLILVGMLLFNLVTSLRLSPILFVFGGESREEILSRAFAPRKCITLENYEMIKYINTKTDESSRILAFGYPFSYYIERDYFADYRILNEKDTHKLIEKLKRERITHIFVKPVKFVKLRVGCSWEKPELEGDPFPVFREIFGNEAIFSDEFKDKYLMLVASCGGQYLYEINYPQKF